MVYMSSLLPGVHTGLKKNQVDEQLKTQIGPQNVILDFKSMFNNDYFLIVCIIKYRMIQFVLFFFF